MNLSIDQEVPLVSVCIPVYNGEKYIKEAINSVLSQNLKDFELLILDNCSLDSTAVIIKNIKDERIRYIKNSNNIGSINNFNKCVELAVGKYFLLLPHDDMLLPGSLEKFVDKLNDSNIGFVYSAIKVIDKDGNTLKIIINHNENKLFNSEETLRDIADNFVPIQLVAARMDVMKKLVSFDIKYGLFCDIQFWLRVIFDGWKTFYYTEPLSCHRVHLDQGQSAFLEADIETISNHWGKELDKSFFKDNSYNQLLLNLIIFISSENRKKSNRVRSIDNSFLKIFIRSHLKGIYSAIVKTKINMLWYEVLLFKDVIKKYGFFRVAFYYSWIVIYELGKLLIYKATNILRSF
jgi:glycosyltransferase involved in cell wall biosynthesis